MRAEISLEELRWRARAAKVVRRVNFGWWWHLLNPALVGVNLAGAGALLLFRQMRWPLLPWASLLGLAWLLAAGWAWWKARARFYAQAEGLLRLETYLGWHNVLSAAAAGGISWPELPEEPVRALRWRWSASARPVLASLAFLLAARFIPVGAPPKPALPPPTQLPPALQQVQSWTDTLKEQKLVEPAMMESWEERLEQLKQKPQQEWYGQESLEADESLRNQMAQEIDTMGKNMKKAADLVDAMQNLPAGASVPADLDGALSQQASALQGSNLPLRQDLALSLNNAKSLSASQLQDLKNQLQLGANAMSSLPAGNASGPGQPAGLLDPYYHPPQPSQPGQGQPGPPSLFSRPGQGQGQGSGQGSSPGQGQGQGANGDAPGQSGPHDNGINNAVGSGGPGGGGGTNGITYESPTDVQAKNQQGVSSSKLDAPLPGDVVGISKSAPQRDPQDNSAAGPGGGASAGGSGEAVWREELTPQERALLQQYFK